MTASLSVLALLKPASLPVTSANRFPSPEVSRIETSEVFLSLPTSNGKMTRPGPTETDGRITALDSQFEKALNGSTTLCDSKSLLSKQSRVSWTFSSPKKFTEYSVAQCHDPDLQACLSTVLL